MSTLTYFVHNVSVDLAGLIEKRGEQPGNHGHELIPATSIADKYMQFKSSGLTLQYIKG